MTLRAIKIYYLSLLALCLAGTVMSQTTQMRFGMQLNVGMNVTGQASNTKNFIPFVDATAVYMQQSRSTQKSNYSFALTASLSQKLTLRSAIGIIKYGIQYSGTVYPSAFSGSVESFEVKEYYNVRFMEVSTVLEYRDQVNENLAWYGALGAGWLTNARRDVNDNLHIFYKSNNFSWISEVGLEVPVTQNRLFARLGIQARVPLNSYADEFTSDTFSLYAVGLQTSIRWQF